MPQPTPLLGVADARAHIASRAFTEGEACEIGVELEWFTRNGSDSTRNTDFDLVRRTATSCESRLDAKLTFEPGGQVELSSRPGSLSGVIDATRRDIVTLAHALERQNVKLSGTGVNPGPPRERVVDTGRYRAMEQYFVEGGSCTDIGAGPAMMNETAAIQVNVGLGSGPDIPRRWNLLNGLGPVLLAAFANSPKDPLPQHGVHAWASNRMRVWGEIDPGRTGTVRSGARVDPSDAWAEYALDARVMMIPTASANGARTAILEELSMRDWIRDGHALGYPSLADLDEHLSTLFPPLRPRGWVELRMIDMPPRRWWDVPAAVVQALITNARPGETEEALADMGDERLWHNAARSGLHEPRLARAAQDCFGLASEILTAGGDNAMAERVAEYGVEYVNRGRMPSDDWTGDWPATLAPPVPATNREATTARCRADLETSRQRLNKLTRPLDQDQLCAQYSEIMSPVVWDIAHIANYEELWLLHNVAGLPTTSAVYDDMYNAFEHPRATRPDLALLGPSEARAYASEVRARVLEVLDKTDFAHGDELLDDGFVYSMVAQHEHQHIETVLATLALMPAPGFSGVAGLPEASASPHRPPAAPIPGDEVFISAGPAEIGTDMIRAYDNEKPAHMAQVDGFWIGRHPVTNGEYLAFIDAGGYEDRSVWTDEGWRWRSETGATAPLHWLERDSESAVRNRFGIVEEVPPMEPVQHVSWFEADAYCRWAGKRLPTETEWEMAAAAPTEHVAGGRRPLYPWGDSEPGSGLANLSGPGGCRFGPAPIGSFPDGASAAGCEQMLGDVWEWTASEFGPYPGFRAFPYREYSEVFFGSGHKVLRGGSWATHPPAIRTTFRNWDLPIRRQIFSGFRCARDASADISGNTATSRPKYSPEHQPDKRSR